MFCKKVNIKRFLLSFDNINFYKKVQNQRFYNKNYQVIYNIYYIYFIKSQRFFFYHIVNYEIVNKFILKDFLLTLAKF